MGRFDLIPYLLEALLVVNVAILGVACWAHRHRSKYRSPHGPIR